MSFKNYYKLMEFYIFYISFILGFFYYYYHFLNAQIMSFLVRGNLSGRLLCPFNPSPSNL